MANIKRFWACVLTYTIFAYILSFGWHRFALGSQYIKLGVFQGDPTALPTHVIALELIGLAAQGMVYALAYPFYAPRRSVFVAAYLFQWSVQAAHVAAITPVSDCLLYVLLESLYLVLQLGAAGLVVPLFYPVPYRRRRVVAAAAEESPEPEAHEEATLEPAPKRKAPTPASTAAPPAAGKKASSPKAPAATAEQEQQFALFLQWQQKQQQQSKKAQ